MNQQELQKYSIYFISTHTPACGMNVSFWQPMKDNQRFQPTPRMGIDCIHPCTLCYVTISTHTPVWGWTTDCLTLMQTGTHFNPHPRMGMNDTPVVNFHLMHNFNPHPAWGWTKQFDKESALPNFQLTPRKGWTYWFAVSAGHVLFNPHPRMGMNNYWIGNYPISYISTHTPVWGWTSAIIFCPSSVSISTHTPVWGWTNVNDAPALAAMLFQPTPPYGDEQL